MEEHCKHPHYDIKMPDSYAVWQLNPDNYNPKCSKNMKGGKIFACKNSPPMACLDKAGNAWVPQDQS